VSGSGGARLLATDLDGTLMRADNTVSARTVAALAAARAAGLAVVFVTGRPPRWMPEVVAATGHAGVAVCANGALLLDLDTDRVLAAHPLPRDTLVAVVGELLAVVPGANLAVEYVPDGSGPGSDVHPAFGHTPGYVSRLAVGPGRLVGGFDELVDAGPVVKLLVRAGAGTDPDDLLSLARCVVGDRVEVTHSSSGQPLLEISAAGVSKGTTLAAHANSLGVAATETITVGDMPNDVPMLLWAGRSYAVEGGHPAALSATTGRVRPPQDDGVALLLESLVQGGRPLRTGDGPSTALPR
jgi:hydroxymethylpyrimidine pyrophosphatase-like HAD family hydrolase